MCRLTKGMKIGLLIQLIGFILIIICIGLCKPVPDVVIWFFKIGLFISFISIIINIGNNI